MDPAVIANRKTPAGVKRKKDDIEEDETDDDASPEEQQQPAAKKLKLKKVKEAETSKTPPKGRFGFGRCRCM